MIINFNSNLILWETDKAYLVKLPKTDYQFWVSKKLCKIYGKSGYMVRMFVPENFEVKIQKTGKSKFNKFDIIDEKILNYKEFIKYFGFDLKEELDYLDLGDNEC